MAPRAGARRARRRTTPLARAELLIALGDVRWQASEPGARAAFDEAAELARARAAPEALARAVLGAGGRFYMPTARDAAYVERLEQALAALGDTRRAAARAAAGPARRAPRARATPATARSDSAPRRWRWRARGGDAGALAAALMGRHAALLDIDHVDERLALIDEALAVAERLEAGELVALALHWRIYDLVELGESPRPGARYERLQALAHELHQPLYSHAALAWRAVCGAPRRAASRRPSGSRASRCGSPRRPGRPRRARSSSRSCSPCGASRAGSPSWPSRSSGSPASPARSG